MHIEDLRDYCLSLKGTTEDMPFGPDTLVFKIGGKVYMLVGLDQIDELKFNVKCNPEYAVELRQQYSQTIIPGYHMNKKHWNTVYCNRELDDETLMCLISDSYHLVFKSLPVKVREEIAQIV